MPTDLLELVERLSPQQAREFLRFRNFAGKFWTIGTKSQGFQPFRINRGQIIVDDEFERQWSDRGYVRLNILKARQQGNTTYCTRRALKYTMHRSGVTALTIADKKETPSEWLTRCSRNVAETPTCLMYPQERVQAGHQIAFKNGSRYYIGSAQGGFPGVGDTVHFLHLSELCWWDKPPISKDPEEVLFPLAPAIPSGDDIRGSVVLRDSTGQMVGDWWHRAWIEGKRDDSEYVNIFLPWFLIETYRREDMADAVTGLSKFEQELVRQAAGFGVDLDHSQIAWYRNVLVSEFHGNTDECRAAYPANEDEAFMAPGLTVYKPHHILAARKTEGEPIWRGDILGDASPELAKMDPNGAGECKIWDHPDPRYHYVLGADCQWGKKKEADWDVAYVECLETGRVVAKCKGQYPLEVWGWKIAALGHKYNECPVAPERNGQESGKGETVMAALLGQDGRPWRYPNVWVRSDDTKLKGWMPKDYGWWTDHHTKGQMIATSLNGTLDGSFDWRDKEAIDQAQTIIRHEDNSIGAPVGLHDDDWMARIITGELARRVRPGVDLYVEAMPGKAWDDLTDTEKRVLEHVERMDAADRKAARGHTGEW